MIATLTVCSRGDSREDVHAIRGIVDLARRDTVPSLPIALMIQNRTDRTIDWDLESDTVSISSSAERLTTNKPPAS